jgi:hypothetical protein
MLTQLARTIILFGVGMIGLGVLLLVLARLNIHPGRLPGDIVYRGRHSVVYVPWVTMLLVSLVLTLLVNLFTRR